MSPEVGVTGGLLKNTLYNYSHSEEKLFVYELLSFAAPGIERKVIVVFNVLK